MEAIDKGDCRVRSGRLPAFFAFSVQSPTMVGLAGTGSSIAPVIHAGNSKNRLPFFLNPIVSSTESAGAIVVEPVTGLEYPFSRRPEVFLAY
ncbi:MAG: hypothetical protein H0W34_02660 [Pyrinomonadaceae bacterium]|nr:hypothetical protein [Pyrinomonadaceae bacterium]